MRHLRSALALAGLVACATPVVAVAQKLEVTPFFASHYSLSPYMDEQIDFGGGSETIKERTGNGPAFGARLIYWLKPTLGIEVEGVYSEADQVDQLPDRDPATGAPLGFVFPANATMFSGRLVYRPRRSNLRLFGGVSQVSFSGDIYTDALGYSNLSATGAVVGFAVRAQATRSLALDVAVEAYLHSLDRGDGPWVPDGITLQSAPQQEVFVTVGVPIKLMN